MHKWLENPLRELLRERDRLPHALLLRGPQGIGKETLAEALAASLLCERPEPDQPACGQCPACLWLAGGNHPDYRVLQPEAALAVGEEGAEPGGKSKEKPSVWITVEQVRELQDYIHVASHRGGRKVIVVSPAESLNLAAANALLKSLEEPPARTHFILISHRPHRLLRTILSRCRQLPLSKPAAGEALAWLMAQGVDQPEVVLAQASGAPLLAQALAAGDELAGRRECLRLLADSAFDPLAAAETLNDLGVERFAGWLLRWTGDLVEQRMLGRVRYNPDFAGEIAILARRIEPLSALRLHRKLLLEQRHVQHPLNVRLYLESLLLAYHAMINPVRRAA
jgi:DNA polymerase-3 subunit delta'